MEEIVLEGKLRPGRGSADARRARIEGWTTGNLYGHGEENVSFLVSQYDLHRLVSAGHHLLHLDFGSVKDVGIMKELQFDTFGDKITHVDFLRVSLDEVIETNVEVRAIGNARGVASGGTLDIIRHDLPLRGKARDLPEHIDLEVDALGLGDAIRAKDVKLPAGVELLLTPEDAIIVVHAPVIEKPPEAPAAEGAPPVAGTEPPKPASS
jgi:large subunit ribosomal protein L25